MFWLLEYKIRSGGYIPAGHSVEYSEPYRYLTGPPRRPMIRTPLLFFHFQGSSAGPRFGRYPVIQHGTTKGESKDRKIETLKPTKQQKPIVPLLKSLCLSGNFGRRSSSRTMLGESQGQADKCIVTVVIMPRPHVLCCSGGAPGRLGGGRLRGDVYVLVTDRGTRPQEVRR
jgi:hypothetical protein